MKKKAIDFFNKLLFISVSILIISAPYSKRLIKISFVAAFSSWVIIHVLVSKLNLTQPILVRTPVNKQLLFFFFALMLSTLFSQDPYYSHSILLERYLGFMLLFCLGSYLVNNLRNIERLIWLIMGAGVIMCAGGIWDHMHNPSIRLGSSFGQPISIIRFLVLFTPLNCIILIFIKNKKLKLSALFNLLFLFPCLIFAYSRGSWAAVLFSVLVITFFKNRKITYCFLLCIIVIGLFLPMEIKQRAITTFNPLTWGERIPLWKISLKIFRDHPLLGAGLGMQEKLYSHYWKWTTLSPEFHYWHSHNNYLEILAEMGSFGLSAFLAIFIVFFNKAFRVIGQLSDQVHIILLGLIGSIICALIFAFSASNITVGVQEVVLFWFIFGMAAGMSVLKKSENTN